MNNLRLTFALIGFCFLAVFLPSSRGSAEDSFAEKLRQSEGTTVKWFMWGGSPTINNWVDGFVAPRVKQRYNITLQRVPADAAVFVNKLLTENRW